MLHPIRVYAFIDPYRRREPDGATVVTRRFRFVFSCLKHCVENAVLRQVYQKYTLHHAKVEDEKLKVTEFFEKLGPYDGFYVRDRVRWTPCTSEDMPEYEAILQRSLEDALAGTLESHIQEKKRKQWASRT